MKQIVLQLALFNCMLILVGCNSLKRGLINDQIPVQAQETPANFVIVTIEKKTNGVHKKLTDYWIISRELWNQSPGKSIAPLYLFNFSSNDFNECCVQDTLILFNYLADTTILPNPERQKSQNNLIEFIKKRRSKIQTYKGKKRSDRYKEKRTVYLTPIIGEFCFCSVFTAAKWKMASYTTAMPVSSFTYDSTFSKSRERKDIENYKFNELPFMVLHRVQ